MSYSSEVLADSPLFWGRLGETSGTTMIDSSGNGRNGVYGNSMTLNQTGAITDGDKAISPSAASSYGKITGASWMDVVNWTVEGWYNRGTSTITRVFTREAGPGQSVNPDYVWSIQTDSSGKPQAVVFRSGSASVITAASALTASTWYHIALTWNGTTLTLYVNGVSVGTATPGGAIQRSTATDIVVLNARSTAAGDLSVGNAGTKADEFAFYNTALSSTRLLAHYNAGIAAAAITGTDAATLPSLTASVAGTVSLPSSSGTVPATLPPLTASVAGTTAVPVFTGTVAATLPALTASVAGMYTPATVTGTADATLPALTASFTGTHTSNDQAGTVSATLPALTAALSGDYTPPITTGTVTATLPPMAGSTAGDILNPVTVTVAAALPALQGSSAGGILNPVTGTIAATLPALTALVEDRTDVDGTITATLPSLTPTVTGLVPTLGGQPWSTDLSGRALLALTATAHASVTPPLAVVPTGRTERSITRRSRIVPDLTAIEGVIVDPRTNQPRIPDDVFAALPLAAPESVVGVPHLIMRGHTLDSILDLTYFRNGVTILGPDRREEPFGDKTFWFEIPSVTSMNDEASSPESALGFLSNRCNVELVMVGPEGTITTMWAGHIVSSEKGNDDTRPTTRFNCVGTLYQASTDVKKVQPFLDPTDIGTLIPESLNRIASRRYPLIPRVATGILSTDRGAWSDSPLGYTQNLLSTAFHEDGRQLTLGKVPNSRASYELRWKKTTSSWTVTNGAPGVTVDLGRDSSALRNVVYAHGVGPDGYQWANTKYPNLHADTAPLYTGSLMSLGSTDASSNGGVSLWQQRAKDLGYKIPVDGVLGSADIAIVRTVQRRFGVSVDGVIGPQTWAATFDVGANGGDLSGVTRLPLAADPRTQRWLYNANGSVAGRNPEYNWNVITYADDVDMGSVTLAEGTISAQQIVDRESEPGLTGTLTLAADPRENSRFFINPGDKITLVGYEASNKVLHISAVDRDWQNLTVRLEVDEKSRDAMTLAQIRVRNREARKDPARRVSNNNRSRLEVNQIVPFDGESGAGRIPKFAVYGGLWSVIHIPLSQVGTIAKIRMTAGAPFAVGLFGAPITPANLVSLVGNPFASDSPYEANMDTLVDRYWFVDAWGQKDQRCGYFPSAESRDAPFTGVFEQTGTGPYQLSRGPWVWVAVYASASCFVQGRIWPEQVI